MTVTGAATQPPGRPRRVLLDQCQRVSAYLIQGISLDDAAATSASTFRSEQWTPPQFRATTPNPKARPAPRIWATFEHEVDRLHSAWPKYMLTDIPIILNQMPRDLQRLYVLHFRGDRPGVVKQAVEQGRDRTTIYRQRLRVLEYIALHLWDDHYQPRYLTPRRLTRAG